MTSEVTPVPKRKPKFPKVSGIGSKRHHASSKSASRMSKLSKEEQKSIDAGIMEALDSAISQGMLEVESEKKKKFGHGKKKNNSSSAGLFDIVTPITGPLTPSRHLLSVDALGGMSSLEALKAVTGAALPQQVPPSPRLPSASAALKPLPKTLPGSIIEEATSGRYSFRQNLKPVKGTSNFIQRLIAKTSSKRYTAVKNSVTVAETAAELNWDTTPPKIHHSELRKEEETATPTSETLTSRPQTPALKISTPTRNSPLSCVVSLSTDIALKLPLASPPSYSNSPKNSLRFSTSSDDLTIAFSPTKTLDSAPMDVCDDLEPNLNNLGLSKAEEDLIDQTIKGVDHHIFMDADKIVGDDVLAVDDISKDDLGQLDVSNSLDVSITDSIDVSHSDPIDASNTDILTGNGDMQNLNTNNKVSVRLSRRDLLKNKVGSVDVSETKASEAFETEVQEQENLHLRSGSVISVSSVCEDANNLTEIPSVEVLVAEKHAEEIVDEDGGGYVFTVESLEDGQDSILEGSTTEVIYDALDTCATYVVDSEVGAKTVTETSLEILGEHESEEDFEKMTQKISQDLASGRTIDKVKSAASKQSSECCVTASEDVNSIASVCDALLTMASPPNFSANREQYVLPVPEPDSAIKLNADSGVKDSVELNVSENAEKLVGEQRAEIHDLNLVTHEQPPIVQSEEQFAANGQESLKDSQVSIVIEPGTDKVETQSDILLESSKTDSTQIIIPDHPNIILMPEIKMPDEPEVTNDSIDDESELCLPSDFFIDEDLLEEAQQQARNPVKKVHVQPKLSADQDIVRILNSIMSNRAFLDDPIARAQRESLDRRYMKDHGLQKELQIKLKSVPENVVNRAKTGPVPVRTIRTGQRRTSYVGTVKVDEVCMANPQRMLPVITKSRTVFLTVLPSKPGAVSKSILNPRGSLVSLPVSRTVKRIFPVMKTVAPKEVKKSDSEDSGRSTPLDRGPALIKKGIQRPYKCPTCPRTYAICEKMLKLHVRFHVPEARHLHCPECFKAGTVWKTMLRHYITHPVVEQNASLYELIETTLEQDKKMCGQCNKEFVMRHALISHLENEHTGEASKSINLHKLKESKSIEKKLPAVVEVLHPKPCVPEPQQTSFLCPNCPYSAMSHYNLTMHVQQCQGSVQKVTDPISKFLDDLSPQFKCSLCGVSAVSSKQLEQHMRLQHGGSNNSNSTLKAKHGCSYCSEKFMTIIQLHSHMSKHKEATMFTCKVCNYTCCYKKTMHKHANKNHQGMSLKSIIQAPKKLKYLPAIKPDSKRFKRDSNDFVESDIPEVKEEMEVDDEIPTANLVIHTDENGELVVCEDEASSIPEETTYMLDSSTLEGNAMTLDGNMIQIIQGDNVDCNGQPKVLYLSVAPQELNSGNFSIAEGQS